MPRILQTMGTMRATTDLPVGETDYQGPLTTALQIIGYNPENVKRWCRIAQEEAQR